MRLIKAFYIDSWWKMLQVFFSVFYMLLGLLAVCHLTHYHIYTEYNKTHYMHQLGSVVLPAAKLLSF